MRNILKLLLAGIIFFGTAPVLQASEKAGTEEIKKKKKKKKLKKEKGKKQKGKFFSKLFGSK